MIPVVRLLPVCAGCSLSCRTAPGLADGAVLTATPRPARLAVWPGGETASPLGCPRTGWSSPPSPTATRRLSASTPRWAQSSECFYLRANCLSVVCRDQRRTRRVVSSAWQVGAVWRRNNCWSNIESCSIIRLQGGGESETAGLHAPFPRGLYRSLVDTAEVTEREQRIVYRIYCLQGLSILSCWCWGLRCSVQIIFL